MAPVLLFIPCSPMVLRQIKLLAVFIQMVQIRLVARRLPFILLFPSLLEQYIPKYIFTHGLTPIQSLESEIIEHLLKIGTAQETTPGFPVVHGTRIQQISLV